jgi:hypothetical protein
MEYAHKNVYGPEGKWKAGDWYTQPAGIKRINNEVYPAWYDQKQSIGENMVFDRVSKKKATDCTPEAAKISVVVTKVTDPTNQKVSYVANDGYDASADDDAHKCDDAKPEVGSITVTSAGGNKYKISVSVVAGKFTLTNINVDVNGKTIATLPATSSGTYSTTYEFTDNSTQTIAATATDDGYYTSSSSITYSPSVNQTSHTTDGRRSRLVNRDLAF